MAVEVRHLERDKPLGNRVAVELVAELVGALEGLAAAVRASAVLADEAPVERAPERESGGRAPSGSAAAAARRVQDAKDRERPVPRKGKG